MYLGNSELMAPDGCSQWFTGIGPGHVSTDEVLVMNLATDQLGVFHELL